MDLGTIIANNWKVIAAAPAVFIVFGLACGTAGYFIARAFFSARAETLRERLEAAKEDVARLKGEKDTMLGRLEAHGEDISKVKAELAALPRIHTTEEPPDNAKDGDVWIPFRP